MIKNRADLALHFAQLGMTRGAEIGVLTGEYAKVLCNSIPHLKYYGIDPWYKGRENNRLHKGHMEQAQKKLAAFDATLINKYSLEALTDFEDSSLDFVYIDGNHHFDFVVNDIIEWTKKVKKGGIVAGHDYGEGITCGVIPAVNGFVRSHFLNLNLTTDPSEALSWWFVKRWNTNQTVSFSFVRK